MAIVPCALTNEIQIMDEMIVLEMVELEKVQSQVESMRTRFLNVQMENKMLYQTIALEEQSFFKHQSARTRDELDVLRDEMDRLTSSAESTWHGYQSEQREGRDFVLLWQKVMRDLPKEWFYQDDETITKMIEEITFKIDDANADLVQRKEEFEREKYQSIREDLERKKSNQKLEIVIRNLKRKIIGLQLSK